MPFQAVPRPGTRHRGCCNVHIAERSSREPREPRETRAIARARAGVRATRATRAGQNDPREILQVVSRSYFLYRIKIRYERNGPLVQSGPRRVEVSVLTSLGARVPHRTANCFQ